MCIRDSSSTAPFVVNGYTYRSFGSNAKYDYAVFVQGTDEYEMCIRDRATRESFGMALCELAKTNKDIIVFDADLAAATKTGIFKKERCV